MPTTNCPTCAHDHDWSWEEAFNKFGFNDGDGLVMTESVANVLRAAGYVVTTEHWGLHNTVIVSIEKDGIDHIPNDFNFRDDEPRDRLPAEIIKLLDEADHSKTYLAPSELPAACEQPLLQTPNRTSNDAIMSTLYNHAFTFGFSIDASDPAGDRIPAGALRARIMASLAAMSDVELLENLGAPFDTYQHDAADSAVQTVDKLQGGAA